MWGGGPAPSSISGVPPEAPPSSELSTSPVRSVWSALERVTVGPAPGTESPIAPLSAYRSSGNGSTIRTTTYVRDRANTAGQPVTWTAVPYGSGTRIAGDLQ